MCVVVAVYGTLPMAVGTTLRTCRRNSLLYNANSIWLEADWASRCDRRTGALRS